MSDKNSTKKLVYMALLVALSFVGSMVKIQGSIALDSMPAFVGALLLGPMEGALIGFVAHILTALTSGFPHTIIVHLVIGLGMGLTAYGFAYLYRKFNPIFAILVACLINGPLLLFLLWPITKALELPLQGRAFFLALVFPLSLVALINLLLAWVVYKLIESKI